MFVGGSGVLGMHVAVVCEEDHGGDIADAKR